MRFLTFLAFLSSYHILADDDLVSAAWERNGSDLPSPELLGRNFCNWKKTQIVELNFSSWEGFCLEKNHRNLVLECFVTTMNRCRISTKFAPIHCIRPSKPKQKKPLAAKILAQVTGVFDLMGVDCLVGPGGYSFCSFLWVTCTKCFSKDLI